MLAYGFFESLAQLPAVDAKWKELEASLAVLRLANEAFARREIDAGSIAGVRERIDKVKDFFIRPRLLKIASTIEQGDRRTLRRRLMAFAADLHARGDFGPANDFYSLIVETASDDIDLQIKALFGSGYALRMLSQPEAATEVYELCRALARSTRDKHAQLRASLCLASVLTECGKVSAAESAVRTVLASARASGQRDVIADALINLAWIAGVRHDPSSVIEHSWAAFRDVRDDYKRDRIRLNMATAFRELKLSTSARRLATHVAHHAHHSDDRIRGNFLLYQLAIDDEDWTTCEGIRAVVAEAPIVPVLEAEYQEVIAREFATRGDVREALAAIDRALAVAEEHRLSDALRSAKEARDDIRRGIIPAAYEYRPVERIPKSRRRLVARIEDALEELCAA